MTFPISSVVIPYPDFRLGQVIDPEQFDQNNQRFAAKINEIVIEFNSIIEQLKSTSGASIIGTLPDSLVDGVTVAEQLSDLSVKVEHTSFSLGEEIANIQGEVNTFSMQTGSRLIGSESTTGLEGSTVYQQLLFLKSRIDSIQNEPIINTFASINDIIASEEVDSVTFVGGTGVTVTTNPLTKVITITATGDATPGLHGASHVTGGADAIPVATETEDGLMSSEHVTMLVNVPRIIISTVAPVSPTNNTYWFHDLGTSNNLDGVTTLLVGNASLDNDDDVWFDESSET